MKVMAQFRDAWKAGIARLTLMEAGIEADRFSKYLVVEAGDKESDRVEVAKMLYDLQATIVIDQAA